MERSKCPNCGNEETRQVFSAFDFDYSVEPFEIVQCVNCGLVQTIPMLDPGSLDKYYSDAYYGSGNKKFPPTIEFLTVLGNKIKARKILSFLPDRPPGGDRLRILDIGCGRANLLRQLDRMGCECHGIERSAFSSDDDESNLNIHRTSLEDVNFEQGYFDAAIIWHVLEHLHTPFETLDAVSRVTKTGGIVAIAVPNFSSFQARWFKSNWFHLDLPRHLYHFDVDNLSHALTERDFKIETISTCSKEQNIFGFIQSFLNQFRFLGRPNKFYQLLKQHSGFIPNVKMAGWLVLTFLIFPFALIEFVVSCVMKKGASVVVFARKMPG